MEPIYSEAEINNFSTQLLQILFQPHNPYYGGHFNFSECFPETIQRHMTDFITDDLKELGHTVQHSLWTAASLMAFRIFEETVMVHVSIDLNISINNIHLGKAIDHMSKTFKKSFVEELHKIRKLRNKGMHPEHQFSRQEVIDLIYDILWIFLFVYSIPPE